MPVQPTLSTNFSTVKFNSAAVSGLLRGPEGPVYRHMLKQGDKVREGAKKRVGVSKPDPVPRKKPHQPGSLRNRIVKRVASAPGGDIIVQVGADVPYAMYHHQGIPGGVRITPRDRGYTPTGRKRKSKRALVFYWPAGGGVVAFASVTQGAVQGNPFLVDALQEMDK